MNQISWPNLMPVALRLHVMERCLLSSFDLNVCRDESAKMVRDAFYEATQHFTPDPRRKLRTDIEAQGDSAAIEGYFRRVGADFLAKVRPLVGESNDADNLIDLVTEVCRIRACEICCKEAHCRWTIDSLVADLDRVASHGYCIRPVKVAFEWAAKAAMLEYRKSVGRLEVPAPFLETDWTSDHNELLELAIDAATFESSGQGRGRAVCMSFHPESLRQGDYLSMAYLFAHECIAHAWCGLEIVEDESTGSQDFHDGWMDNVTACVLEEHLWREATLSPENQVEQIARINSRIWTQTKAVRGLRFNAEREVASPDVEDWIVGGLAMDELRALFALQMDPQNYDPQPSWDQDAEALSAVIRLSLQVNSSTIGHDDRAKLVSAIWKTFVRTDEKARAQARFENRQIFDFIEQYLITGDFRLFVAQVLNRWPD